jgi:hypothetical protein
MRGVAAPLAVVAALVLSAPSPAFSEERTVTGTIVRLDSAAGTLTVKDAAGVAWSYTADPDAGIDLGGFREGERVTVTIARPTPWNMNTAADRLRKGDRVGKSGF